MTTADIENVLFDAIRRYNTLEGGATPPFIIKGLLVDEDIDMHQFIYPSIDFFYNNLNIIRETLIEAYKVEKIQFIASFSMAFCKFFNKEESFLADLELDIFESCETVGCLVLETSFYTKLFIIPYKDDKYIFSEMTVEDLSNPYLICNVLRPLTIQN